MPSTIRDALASLQPDPAALRLAPPADIRARGDVRRRRLVAVTAGAGAAAVAVAVVVLLPGSGGSSAPTPAGPTGTAATCGALPSPPDKFSPTPAVTSTRSLTVFLALNATPAQRDHIASVLSGLPSVGTYEFVSRAQAYERLKVEFCSHPELIDLTRPDSLPESFQVVLDDPAEFAGVRAQLVSLPGVEAVIAASG